MVEVKCVINDTKTGKSYQKSGDLNKFIGKKLHDKVEGASFGLSGYELELTGGSDNAGFPMRDDIPGNLRKKALLSDGVGVHIKRKGLRLRKTVRGNQVDKDIAQLNLKITKYGKEPIEKALGLVKEEPVPADGKTNNNVTDEASKAVSQES